MKWIIFGCGQNGALALDLLGRESVAFFADNNAERWGTEVYGVPVVAPDELARLMALGDYAVMVSPALRIAREICAQLAQLGITRVVVLDIVRNDPAVRSLPLEEQVAICAESICPPPSGHHVPRQRGGALPHRLVRGIALSAALSLSARSWGAGRVRGRAGG